MKILCLGDSITAGYNLKNEHSWPSLLQNKLGAATINHGISGDTTGGMLARFYHHVVPYSPSHVIIMGGINDIWWNVDQNLIQANIQSMVKQAEHNGISPIIGSPLPVNMEGEAWGLKSRLESSQKRITQLAKSLQVQARMRNKLFLNIYDLFLSNNEVMKEYYLDCIHPSEEGHELIAAEAAKILKNL